METFLQAITAVMLIWADPTVNYIGIALFFLLLIIYGGPTPFHIPTFQFRTWPGILRLKLS
jgi:hypothetical protein